MKRLLCVVLIAFILLCMADQVTASAEPVAGEMIQVMVRVRVDGVQYELYGYNFNRLSYVKLRDVAYILNHSEKQFSIGFDNELKRITVSTGSEYIPIGTEMQNPTGAESSAARSANTLIVDGENVELGAYIVGGYNYYDFRDLASLFDFDTIWDGVINNAICINTNLDRNPNSRIPLFTRYYYYLTLRNIGHDGIESEYRTVIQEDYDRTREEMQIWLNRPLARDGFREIQVVEFEQCVFWKQLEPDEYRFLIIQWVVNGVHLSLSAEEYLAFVDAGMREESLIDCISEEHYQEYLRDRNSGSTNEGLLG